MLCQNCGKNEASVHYKENINGRIKEYDLCPECAAELEKNSPVEISSVEEIFKDKMFDLTPLISGLFGLALGAAPSSISETKRCPVCGSTFAEIAKSGRIGCPECYKTFENELEPTVNQLHGASKMVGRAPKRLGEKHRREEKIASLKAELQQAIEAQAFEHAAELRDEIKALENDVANSESPAAKSTTDKNPADNKNSSGDTADESSGGKDVSDPNKNA